MIPFYIPSYNNGFLVENTVNGIRLIASKNPIIILDNASHDHETKEILQKLSMREDIQVKFYQDNPGPWRVLIDSEFEEVRRRPFVLTDPDLDLTKLPLNTLEILTEVQQRHGSRRVGLALDISDPEDIITIHDEVDYVKNWESQFWVKPIPDPKYEIYDAALDTTFCLHNFNYPNRSIRVAGELTVKHLPWHKSFLDSLSVDTVRRTFINPAISTTTHSIWKWKGIIGAKDFVVVPDGMNDHFWSVYPGWKPETFTVLDKFASTEKDILDIGCWIGPTVLYAASRYRHVWAIDADKVAIKSLINNIAANKFEEKITVIPKVIYKNTGKVNFGTNLFIPGAALGGSCSQIHEGLISGESINCLSFSDLIAQYNIDNLSLIKVNIEGGEEFILEDLLKYSLEKRVPVYLSFHFSWWKQPDLLKYVPYFEKFKCGDICSRVRYNPCDSILFEPI